MAETTHDLHVQSLDELHDDGATFIAPAGATYAAITPDNEWYFFADEDGACAFQRDWRARHGLHPMTGTRS